MKGNDGEEGEDIDEDAEAMKSKSGMDEEMDIEDYMEGE